VQKAIPRWGCHIRKLPGLRPLWMRKAQQGHGPIEEHLLEVVQGVIHSSSTEG